MTRRAGPRSRISVTLVLASLVVLPALTLAACASNRSAAATPPAAVGVPSTASAAASSPPSGHAATASSIGDGVYLVGTDIPAGRYRGTGVSDAGLWQVSSDSNGSSIIASDTITTTTGQFYVQVKKGQYLKLSGAVIVKAPAAAPTKMRSSVGDGTYLVGTDIPAGRYTGEPMSDWGGSWRISRDANGTQGVHSGRVDRPFHIHVKKGRYLDLIGLTLRPVK
jgi:hypothetical protein